MASLAFAPARRAALAAAIVGALALLLVPMVRAQETSTELPDSVRGAVITAAATQTNTTAANVEILRSEAVTWNDGCLGVAAPGEACTQALVDGFVVWALAGGTVLRYHTDAVASVRLGESGIATSAVAGAALPNGATARGDSGTQQPSAVITGNIPTSGFALFTVDTEANTVTLRQALQIRGCTADTLAKAVDGKWYIYGFDSPAFANAQFFASDGSQSGVVAANTILLTNCVRGSGTPSPTPTGTATPNPTGTASPTPTGTATPGGYSTTPVDQSTRTGSGALNGVTVGEHEGFERIVFQFAEQLVGVPQLATGVPAYRVSYQDAPAACGSGLPVNVPGEAMLVIDLPTTYSYDPEAGISLVTNPSLAQVQSILGVNQSCAFEGHSTWVFGIDSEAGFSISELSGPNRLVIDVQTDAGAAPTATPSGTATPTATPTVAATPTSTATPTPTP